MHVFGLWSLKTRMYLKQTQVGMCKFHKAGPQLCFKSGPFIAWGDRTNRCTTDKNNVDTHTRWCHRCRRCVNWGSLEEESQTSSSCIVWFYPLLSWQHKTHRALQAESQGHWVTGHIFYECQRTSSQQPQHPFLSALNSQTSQIPSLAYFPMETWLLSFSPCKIQKSCCWLIHHFTVNKLTPENLN